MKLGCFLLSFFNESGQIVKNKDFKLSTNDAVNFKYHSLVCDKMGNLYIYLVTSTDKGYLFKYSASSPFYQLKSAQIDLKEMGDGYYNYASLVFNVKKQLLYVVTRSEALIFDTDLNFSRNNDLFKGLTI